ncbi:uncharacterized protein PAE49_006833 [Odontesthes bonariensis]|uniref:uncharacterized protein LOC142382594 n=1 Tax=Odontesthes bonariensis TaxID=219752 RepID=UPI003F587259
MATVGAELAASWFLSAGPVGFFLLLILLFLLSIFLTALCNDCSRRSFELQHLEVERNPSTLIRVVKLEEVRENPMMADIQRDETEFRPKEATAESSSSFQRQQGAPQTPPDPLPEEEPSGAFTPWRSHLMAPQSKDLNGSSHIYQTIEGGRGGGSDAPANHKPAQEPGDRGRNSVYARINKKMRLTEPPVPTAEESQVEEEPSPPLPYRTEEMEG